jgi:hypothetical protein
MFSIKFGTKLLIIKIFKMKKLIIATMLLMSTKCFSQEFEGDFIKVSGTGGTPPYTYSLDNSPYQMKDTFFNVLAGQHTIVTKDSKNCFKTSVCTLYNNVTMKLFIWDGTRYVNAEQYTSSTNNTFVSVKLQGIGGKPPYYFSRNSTTSYTLNKIYWNGLQRNVVHTFRVKDSLGYIYYINITL